MSEEFRRLSDDLLIETVRGLDLPVLIARGSAEERLEQIVEAFALRTVMSVGQATAIAHERVTAAIAVLEDDDRFHDARRRKSFLRRLRYAARY